MIALTLPSYVPPLSRSGFTTLSIVAASFALHKVVVIICFLGYQVQLPVPERADIVHYAYSHHRVSRPEMKEKGGHDYIPNMSMV